MNPKLLFGIVGTGVLHRSGDNPDLETRFAMVRESGAFDYYDRDPLFASQRSFSKEMDNRTKLQGYTAAGAAVYGQDQRIQWGYPASVQATRTKSRGSRRCQHMVKYTLACTHG